MYATGTVLAVGFCIVVSALSSSRGQSLLLRTAAAARVAQDTDRDTQVIQPFRRASATASAFDDAPNLLVAAAT